VLQTTKLLDSTGCLTDAMPEQMNRSANGTVCLLNGLSLPLTSQVSAADNAGHSRDGHTH